MKMKMVAAAVMGLALSTSVFAADTTTLSSDADKLSYSIGADLGRNFKKQGIEINPAAMAQGLQDGIAGGQMLLTDDQMKDVLNTFQKNLMAKRTADMTKQADDNKAKGQAFMAENKGKPGVVTTASGLQYKILEAGTGAKPGKDDSVKVEYTGTLLNGKVFDSTDTSGKAAEFKVSQVIPGWTEVLQLMPAGSTWEVYIPSDLAYGPRSMGGPIGPNETLVFKIHLIDVNKSGS